MSRPRPHRQLHLQTALLQRNDAQATHPEGSLSWMAAALIESQDPNALLARWLRRKH